MGLVLERDFVVNQNGQVVEVYNPTAVIIKWAIFGGIFLFFFVWLVGGYFHAKRRLRKGLPPMAYHRFLVPMDQRQPRKSSGSSNNFTFYQMDNRGYNMNQVPPVYDPNQAPPPTYQPEGTKIDPSQLESQAPLAARPSTARSPKSPFLSRILPNRNK